MTIRQAIWRIGTKPEALAQATLPSEAVLEAMIIASPTILHDQWMLIGQQIDTGFGGRLDLLAVAPDGSLVVIELKRDRTPRDVVAQAIDYASFASGLKPEQIADIYGRFTKGRNLGMDFQARFGAPLDEATLNESHQIVVVAATIDDSTDRIVRYLNDRGIDINVLCFQVFAHGQDLLLSRAWLLDPAQVQTQATPSKERAWEPWNGEFYASFGDGGSRSWKEAMNHGFISAGGGTWYPNTLNLLSPGDRVWVMAPKAGYVGVGRVKARRISAADFMLPTPQGDRPALEVLTEATYHRDVAGDPEKAEYFVPIDWIETRPLDQAVREVGLFANQNTVCKPTAPKWRHTIERLKLSFPKAAD